MGPSDFDPAALDELVQLLKDGGIRSVSLDASEINPPGVWVRLDAVAGTQLRGLTLRTTLFLVVADTDPRRAIAALAALFNQVVPLLPGGPTGETTRAGLVLTQGGNPQPALSVPFAYLTTTEETP